ncbi:hypothetical protein SNEBB_000402 [Seison nebaliae]|nr:hypothetical protein SNEBB_000402 [Seison nebaliae]
MRSAATKTSRLLSSNQTYRQSLLQNTSPTFSDLFQSLYLVGTEYFDEEWLEYYKFPWTTFEELSQIFSIKLNDILITFLVAILFTILRSLINKHFLNPLAKSLNFNKSVDQTKFPESSWKAFIYTIFWIGECYLVLYKYDIFTNPMSSFLDPVRNWRNDNGGTPLDLYIIYIIQSGFYFHSIYGTVYQDHWRKDSIILIIHHLITILLLTFSYGLRYMKNGVLVLFLHDVTDIFLESTKTIVYLKNRNGKSYKIYDHLSVIGFVIFALAWLVFRLYWYPLKILHSSCVAHHIQEALEMHFLLNSLLWFLLLLNLYWYMFVLKLLYKVATGQMNSVNDTREYDVNMKLKDKKKN